MALDPLKINKNWTENNATREANWDEISDKTVSWAAKVNANLKQIGLDLNGTSYDFNNNGVATQSSSVIGRLGEIETTLNSVGVRNIGLDVSTTSIIKVFGSEGSSLSSTNIGRAGFNSLTSPGEVEVGNITSNLSITLTGAHWGYDTYGDLTDMPLFLMFILSGSSVILGVSPQGGRNYIASTDTTTVSTSVNSREKVYISSALSGDCPVIEFGWIYANFDDTGNGGGENFWTIQTGVGDIGLGVAHSIIERTVYF